VRDRLSRGSARFGGYAAARLPLTTEGSPCGTQRAFRSPAGDAKLVPWEARDTFLLLAHARALCVRTAKPARRAEGASPESKSHGISFASKVTQRKWPSEPRLLAVRGIEALEDRGQSWCARYYLERRGYTATRRNGEDLKQLRLVARDSQDAGTLFSLSPPGRGLGEGRVLVVALPIASNVTPVDKSPNLPSRPSHA